jgi:ligand-binding SRPBCC domain-containing protein
MHRLSAEQFIPTSKREAWLFFSSPGNLALITPPEMDFKIIGSLTETEIFEGMKIDYKVSPLLGIPMFWQTEISKVDYQTSFTDTQLVGPYKVWEHTHTFTDVNGGVLIYDEVNYALPFGALGKLVHSLWIRRKIEKIFAYRKVAIESLFK